MNNEQIYYNKSSINVNKTRKLTTVQMMNISINVRKYRRGNQIKNGQSREFGNIGYTRRRKTKPQHNMYQTPLCANKHK